MKNLKPVRNVAAVGLTTLITVTSGLLALPSLRKAFADQIGWLHDHLSPEQATAVGGVLLALGLCLLYAEVRNRGLKPRKWISAMGFLWVISSLGLIFFAPNHLKPPEEIGIGPAEALAPQKHHPTEPAPPTSKEKGATARRGSTESVALVEESSTEPQASPSSTPTGSSSSAGGCTCPTASSSPATPQPEPNEEAPVHVEEGGQEAAQEVREEEQEAAEEAQEEAEIAREEAELGI
jgi:hypothetical protein